MTEEEYFTHADYRPALALHRKVTSFRKWRLFAVACCRLVWHLIPEESRRVVEVVERFIEREASDEEREAVRRTDIDFHREHPAVLAAYLSAEPTARIKTVARHDVPTKCIAAASMEEGRAARATCIRDIAGLVREVFGNPFLIPRPSCHPEWRSWQDATPLKLAQGSYDDRAFDRLPILSDALEEAGCTDAALLDHLRSPGPHVRGCWALDLILGKQ